MHSYFSWSGRVCVYMCDYKRGAGVEEKLKADTLLHLHPPGGVSRQTVMLLCPPACAVSAMASPAFQPAIGRQTRALTPRQQGSEQIRGRHSTPFKGCASSRGKSAGALINIPCVKAADMEG